MYVPQPVPDNPNKFNVNGTHEFKAVIRVYSGANLIVILIGPMHLDGILMVSMARISTSITIRGNGHSIQSQQQEGSFQFTDDVDKHVYLYGIHFVSLGPGLMLQEASATITRCNFVENSHAVIYRPSTLNPILSITIENSTFRDNVAHVKTDVEAAALYIIQVQTVNIHGCNFDRNDGMESEKQFQGAVNIKGFTTLSLTDSSFTTNMDGGLQLIAKGAAPTVYIDDVTFQHGSYAPAVGILGESPSDTFQGSVEIFNSRFLFNQADQYHGGALYLNDFSGNLTVTESIFIGNKGTKAGAISFEGEALDSTDILFDRCTFADNEAGQSGGAIWNDANINTLKFQSCNFTHNTCTYMGGGIHIGQTVNELEISSSGFYNHHSNSYGAGIALFANVGIFTIRSQTIFTGNVAEQEGGAIYYSQVTETEMMSVEFSTFTQNVAPQGGPTLYIDNSKPEYAKNTDFVCVYFDISESLDYGIANGAVDDYVPQVFGCPTVSPTVNPSFSPTVAPSLHPTTDNPTQSPSFSPTTSYPSVSPTVSPTLAPVPTHHPTLSPSVFPSENPSISPTLFPTITDPATLNETHFTYSTPLISGACFFIFLFMICCIVQTCPWESNDDALLGSELMSPFLPNSPERSRETSHTAELVSIRGAKKESD